MEHLIYQCPSLKRRQYTKNFKQPFCHLVFSLGAISRLQQNTGKVAVIYFHAQYQQRVMQCVTAAVDGKNNARLVGGDEFQVEIVGPGNASPKPDIADNNDG